VTWLDIINNYFVKLIPLRVAVTHFYDLSDSILPTASSRTSFHSGVCAFLSCVAWLVHVCDVTRIKSGVLMIFSCVTWFVHMTWPYIIPAQKWRNCNPIDTNFSFAGLSVLLQYKTSSKRDVTCITGTDKLVYPIRWRIGSNIILRESDVYSEVQFVHNDLCRTANSRDFTTHWTDFSPKINTFSWLHINSRLLLVFFCMMWLVDMCDTTDSHTGQTSAQKIAINTFLGGQHIRKTHSTPGWA
jgi:hypothetical protein